MSEKKSAPHSEQELEGSLKSFSELSGEVPESIQHRMQGLEKKIHRELRLSRKRFFSAYALLSIIGYIFSLSLCSQHSIALTNLSLNTAVILHRLPDPWCAIVCGVFFTLVPLLCLFFFLDRFQMRRLVREFWWLPILTALLTCLLMSFLPGALQHEGMHLHHEGLRHTQGDLVWLFWWTIAATAIPALGSFVLNRRFKGEAAQR